MSARAAQWVRQEFGLDLTVERYAKVYEDLLTSPAQVALGRARRLQARFPSTGGGTARHRPRERWLPDLGDAMMPTGQQSLKIEGTAMALDALLALGLVLSTTSQLRLAGGIGPGEICLALWVLVMVAREAVRFGPPLTPALSRLLIFWSIFAAAQCIGTLTGFAIGDRHDSSLFLHDALAYPFLGAMSVLSVVEPGARAAIGANRLARRDPRRRDACTSARQRGRPHQFPGRRPLVLGPDAGLVGEPEPARALLRGACAFDAPSRRDRVGGRRQKLRPHLRRLVGHRRVGSRKATPSASSS